MATVTVDQLAEIGQKNAEGINTLTKSMNRLVDALAKTPAGGTKASDVFGLPNIRSGEDPLTSRGFSFMKMLGLLTGVCNKDSAKVELDIHNRLAKCFDGQYEYRGSGNTGLNRFLAPLATSYLPVDTIAADFRREMKSLVQHGTEGYDPDEQQWISRKMLDVPGYRTKALSWLNEFTGGSLVAPPEQGELIELLRNKEALVNAGARTVPLPPQGRIKYPRQTAASTTYWVGESAPMPDSTPGTGEVTLQAKKLAVRIIAPNELIRFASPAAEALMRDDMTKSLALGLDLAGLEGNGSDTRPRGVINLPNINTVTSKLTAINGDQLAGEDIYRMIAAVEESNAEFEGWIMRPKTWYRYLQMRADAVGQGDKQGMFLFNAIREPGDASAKPALGGFPVTKSTQVSQVRAKGTRSDLSYIVGGMWSDLLIGMFGAIEFASTTQGDTAFTNDQTWVRGILSADIAARHDAAFAFMDNLIVTG